MKIDVSAGNSLLPTLLLVLFIGLKLGGVINWSWCWVLAPFWIPLAVMFVFMGMFLMGMLIAAVVKSKR